MGAHLVDAVCIWFTDEQAGVTGHVGMKYSHIRDIVVSCCVFLNPLRERQCLPVGHRAIVHFVVAMPQWQHWVTFGEVL